jgi:hypothetical protein
VAIKLQYLNRGFANCIFEGKKVHHNLKDIHEKQISKKQKQTSKKSLGYQFD